MSIKKLLLVCFTLMLTAGSLAGAAAAETPKERIDESVQILEEMAEQVDADSMAYLLNRAKGVAIFPRVIKAGLMLGGRYGEGLVLKHDPQSGLWYGPTFVTMKGVSYGLQFGVQSTALVLVITNERGMESFTGGQKITLGGDLSVAAGPVGRHAEASTDIEFEASIYSYSITKGIFAGMSLEGAMIDTDTDANSDYWGMRISPKDILARKAVASEIVPLIKQIEKIMAMDSK